MLVLFRTIHVNADMLLDPIERIPKLRLIPVLRKQQPSVAGQRPKVLDDDGMQLESFAPLSLVVLLPRNELEQLRSPGRPDGSRESPCSASRSCRR